MSLPNDAYGHTVEMTSDDTTDTYYLGGALSFSFPAGTDQDVAYLSMAKQFNLAKARTDTQDYIQTRYSRDQQIQLIIMYEAAVRGLLTTRAAYIAQLLTWVNTIIGQLAVYVAQVQAQTDPAVVAQMSVNVAAFPTDPGVTMLAAVQIPN